MMGPSSPHDGRCQRSRTYHDRLRSDPTLFEMDTIQIGLQATEDLVLELGLCPGCGTTVSRIAIFAPDVVHRITKTAKIDARGWRNRNPRGEITEQVIRNHYSMSRDRGYLGVVPRATKGSLWATYRRRFLDELTK